jgi:hypothetical protein
MVTIVIGSVKRRRGVKNGSFGGFGGFGRLDID